MQESTVRWDKAWTHRDEDVPRDFAGSWHIGDGVFRQRCRECGAVYDTKPGQGSVPRYRGIGPHEYNAHGLDVPGINVGMLP